MIRAVWPLVSAAQMRALDRHTIEDLGVPGEVLMESAGRAVVAAVLARLAPGDSVLVVCGPGNNGGDGLVVARHLHLLGVPVRAALLAERLSGDAGPQLTRARKAGVPIEGKRWRAPASGVIVDALFGTGLARALSGDARASVRRINAARSARPGAVAVIAVDLPSGLSADTGQVLGAAVAADATVTLGLPKLGLAFEPGRGLAGRIAVARIGIADAAPGVRLDASLWTRAGAASALPARPRDGHKGTFGHALLVAGSEGKTGAAALCAEGAARVGAGLVTLACPAGLNDILEAKVTEAMTAPLPDTGARQFAAAAEDGIVALAATRDAVGLGPGIGRERETSGLVRALAKRLDVPLALDADGVVAFAGEVELLRSRRAPTVLTPHPGEAAAVLGVRPAQINTDRAGAARELAARSGAVVVLKGAGTAVAAPEGELIVNPTGGPALASGGTGDVLLGIVTGLLAQGVPAFRAGALAAYLHGAAGDRIAARRGDTGLLASELLLVLPAVITALRDTPAPAPFERELAAAFPEP
jgi:ADP-dependent NAD(P)H-hydrate dehydratase / NAD(P)H-hydrate epimerase